MNIRQLILSASLSTLLTLVLGASILLAFDRVQAAPAVGPEPQSTTGRVQYLSISALAFLPVQQNSAYRKDAQRETLSVSGNNRSFTLDRNRFVAPLTLPDQGELRALTLFGEDYDNQGEVRVRLKRCDHSRALCLNLGETTSAVGFSAGLFETTQVIAQRELIDNRLYSYFLELDLTALGNSGLRAVRLELIAKDESTSNGEQGQWSLSGSTTTFSVPNTGLSEVRVCTNDLSHLDNPTHFPFIAVDNRSVSLSSDSCDTVWGRDIKIRRPLNTGPSSGTYEILR